MLPVEKEIIVESHASIGMGSVRVGSQEVTRRVRKGSSGILERRKEREDHCGRSAVVRWRQEERW